MLAFFKKVFRTAEADPKVRAAEIALALAIYQALRAGFGF